MAKHIERMRAWIDTFAADVEAVEKIVSADKAAHHGVVVHVLDLARTNNITKFAVQVEREAQ